MRRTDHEENLARLRRAESFKRLRVEESIARKDGVAEQVAEQRRQQAQSLASERRRREAIEKSLRADLDAEVRSPISPLYLPYISPTSPEAVLAAELQVHQPSPPP